jgi:hypothetical protein
MDEVISAIVIVGNPGGMRHARAMRPMPNGCGTGRGRETAGPGRKRKAERLNFIIIISGSVKLGQSDLIYLA